MKKLKSKNGFTMVELLAVIVILGLISALAIPSISKLISKSKNENIESHKKTLIMAAESYLQNNKNNLPKDIGERVTIEASKLKEANYLKEDIYNADKKKCMNDSFVKVVKTNTKKYDYTAYIYCEGDTVPSDLIETKPGISIKFTDASGKLYSIDGDNVTSAVVNVEINGGTTSAKEELKLEGYSVIISAKYKKEDNLVEIYNTGSLKANGNKKVIVNRNVTDYIDITRFSYLQVTVEAYNSEGGYNKVTANSQYQDSTKPKCGIKEGEPGEDEWNKNWRTKKISISCDDGKGSGCVRSKFTKTFTKETEYDTIQIKDNAGNTTDCKVRVHLDWTEPTLTINAYKRLANGSAGTRVASATAQKGSTTASIAKYTNGYGPDSWLNKANFPDGVYYEVITEDNVKLGSGEWSENVAGLTKGDSKVNLVSSKNIKEFSAGNNKTSFAITTDGYRYGTYVLKDKALNSSSINITAPLDRVAPTVPTANLYIKKDGENVTSPENLKGYAEGTWLKGWVFTKAAGGADTISQFDHYVHTAEGKTSPAIDATGSYRNINAQGTSTIMYKACDKANNCSGYSKKYAVKLDRNAPSCENILKLESSTGKKYDGKWTNVSIYTTAKCSESGDVSGCSGIKKVTATGSTTNVKKEEESSRMVNASGVSQTTWYVYDKVGNEKECPEKTEKIDKKKPSCSTAKSNKNKTTGVTVKITCKDQSDLSKVDSCPSTKTGVKKSATYKVTDNAGNSNTCNVTVTSEKEYRKRTRKNATCTSSKCCGETSYECNCKSVCSRWCCLSYGACLGYRYGETLNDISACPASSSPSCDTRKNKCQTCKKAKTCTNSCCGYTKWGAWSAWGGSGNYCNSTYCSSESRTIYY